MSFRIEDVELTTSTMTSFGIGEHIRLKHIPTGLQIEYHSEQDLIRPAVKDRLMAELKVMVNFHEYKTATAQDRH